MTAAKLLQDARTEGVLLTLTSAGTLKVTGDEIAIRQWTPKIRFHRLALLDSLRSNLELFRFDLTDDDIESEIQAGYPATDIIRVNNMAWEFIKVDGLPFDEAIRTSAEIVVSCPYAPCEASYEDAWMLWRQCAAQ